MFKEALMKAIDKKGITLEQYYDKIYKPGTPSSRVHMFFKVEAILKSKYMWSRPDFMFQDILKKVSEVLPLYYKSNYALEKQYDKITKIPGKLDLFYYLFNWLLRLHEEVSQEGE